MRGLNSAVLSKNCGQIPEEQASFVYYSQGIWHFCIQLGLGGGK